jgi:hypothetical protein
MDIKTIKFPFTLTQFLGAVLVVNTVLAGGATQLTTLFGDHATAQILAVCTLGTGIVGGFILKLGSMTSQFENVRALGGVDHISINGLVPPDIAVLAMDPDQAKVKPAASAVSAVTATAAKAVIILVLLVAGVFAWPGDVHAQTRKLAAPAVTGDLKKDLTMDGQNLGLIPPSLQVTPTGNPGKDLQAVWDKIVNASTTDLTYASKLAASANTPASGVRKQCWDAIITINNQASGLNLKNADGTPMTKPDPHAFTDVETLAEVIDNLSPSGPLFTACAGAAQLAKTNVLTFVNAVVTGAAGMAAMPIIPGL